MAHASIAVETLKHREAFEFYYSLGAGRGLAAVGKQFNTSAQSIKKWSVSFNWQERVKLRDMEVADNVTKASTAHAVASRAMYRETIGKLIHDFRQNVEDGKIRINKVEDFVKIVNLDLELMGLGSGHEEGNMQSLAQVLRESAKAIGLHPAPTTGDTNDTVVN